MKEMPSWMGGGRCPASAEEKELVEYGFRFLDQHLGRNRLTSAKVIEPTPQFFPDAYDSSEEAATQVIVRVCDFMGIDPEPIPLEFWADSAEREFHDMALAAEPKSTKGASGLYTQIDGADEIRINLAEIKDPESLVSTAAHELSHVLLLGHLGVGREEPHMEALTDLTTIYLGFGIFTANTLLRHRGWTEGNMQGWSVQRKGYISPEMAGWALALFCWARQERKPRWARHLAADPKAYLRTALKYLARTNDTSFS